MPSCIVGSVEFYDLIEENLGSYNQLDRCRMAQVYLSHRVPFEILYNMLVTCASS